MARLRRFFVGRIVGVMVALSVILLVVQPGSTPESRAYRICGACGMDESETSVLIATIRESLLSRKPAMELWRKTAEPLAVVQCSECAEVIADAACRPER